MPFRYLVVVFSSFCLWLWHGEKTKQKKMQREKTKRRNNAWRKDEIVNCAAQTDVNHENKREKTKNAIRNNTI